MFAKGKYYFIRGGGNTQCSLAARWEPHTHSTNTQGKGGPGEFLPLSKCSQLPVFKPLLPALQNCSPQVSPDLSLGKRKYQPEWSVFKTGPRAFEEANDSIKPAVILTPNDTNRTGKKKKNLWYLFQIVKSITLSTLRANYLQL